MELNINEININRYTNGELSGDELKAFETLLQKDEALQEKVDSHQFMDAVLYKNLSAIEESEQTELKPLLKEFDTKYFSEEKDEVTGKEPTPISQQSEQPNSKPNLVRRLIPFAALAAAAALLLFLFIPKSENELYAKYFEVPYNQSKMGPGDPSVFDKANKAYKSQDYKQAITYYNEVLSKDLKDPKALQYKGGAELALNKTDASIITFQKLVQNRRYVDMANWYLALGYLKKGEEEKTKSYLKLITTDDKKYYDKAQQLMKEL